jgi:DNA-3-methyladenine glycosylase II
VKKSSRRAILRQDATIARLVDAAGPCRLKPHAQRPPFESLARAIANQQLNGAVAAKILQRLCALFPAVPFPTPEHLLRADTATLRAVGFSFAKIRALQDLAEKTLSGVVPDSPVLHSLDDEAIIERLTVVRGIGRWTVEMLLMFQLGRPDVWPVDDFGVRNGFSLCYGLPRLPTPRALHEYGERWRPHRSAVAWYLWRAVDLHREGLLPKARKPTPRLAMQKR